VTSTAPRHGGERVGSAAPQHGCRARRGAKGGRVGRHTQASAVCATVCFCPYRERRVEAVMHALGVAQVRQLYPRPLRLNISYKNRRHNGKISVKTAA
jgi:hypothetical protein